ncbi:MAG: hypothetical protein IPK80_27840 [Nannocystis sp.]|nr:hypothetical protein [Nannocystis sp.]
MRHTLDKDPAKRPADAEALRKRLVAELAMIDPRAEGDDRSCCLKGHDGVEQAKACLAAWQDLEDAAALALAASAARENPEWGPLASLIECAAERAGDKLAPR